MTQWKKYSFILTVDHHCPQTIQEILYTSVHSSKSPWNNSWNTAYFVNIALERLKKCAIMLQQSIKCCVLLSSQSSLHRLVTIHAIESNSNTTVLQKSSSNDTYHLAVDMCGRADTLCTNGWFTRISRRKTRCCRNTETRWLTAQWGPDCTWNIHGSDG